MRCIQQLVSAVLVESDDARGIRRDMAEIAGEGLPVVLDATQVKVLLAGEVRVDASLECEET